MVFLMLILWFNLTILFPALGQQELDLAYRYEAMGRIEEARAIYQEFLVNRIPAADEKLFSEVYERYRNLSFQLKSFEEFVSVSKRLLVIHPGELEARILSGIGAGYLKLNKRAEGKNYLLQAVRKDLELTGNIAEIFAQAEMMKDAVGVILDYRKKQNLPSAFAERLILFYEKMKNYKKATDEVVLLLNSNPQRLNEFIPKLLDYYARDRSIIEQVTKVANKQVRVPLSLHFLLSQRRYSEAIEEINSLPEKSYWARVAEDGLHYPVALAVYDKLGRLSDVARVLRKMGKTQEAGEILKKLKTPEAIFELAELQSEELNDPASAVENYRSILNTGKEAVYYGLTQTLLMLGKLKEAKAAIKGMSKTTDRKLFYLLKIALFSLDFDSVAFYSQELTRQFPMSQFRNDALSFGLMISEGGKNLNDYILALFNFERKNWDDAQKTAKTLLGKEGIIGEEAYRLLAQTYLKKNEPAQALAALKELSSRFPKSSLLPKARFEMAQIYREALKDTNNYKKSLEDLIIDFPNSPESYLARSLLNP